MSHTRRHVAPRQSEAASEGELDGEGIEEALGSVVRGLRIERSMSSRELAEATGVSPGFISQLENGLTMPSVATLIKLARALGVKVGDLFDAGSAATRIVRHGERPRYEYPEMGTVDEVLSNDPRGQLEVLIGYVNPGGNSGKELYVHGATSEFVLVVSGSIELLLDDEIVRLAKGDSVTFSGDTPHGFRNPGEEAAEILWVMTPATY